MGFLQKKEIDVTKKKVHNPLFSNKVRKLSARILGKTRIRKDKNISPVSRLMK